MRPAVTADGTPIAVCVNIADPAEIDTLDPASCDGIGLVRTEFLFSGKGGLPDEEAQYRVYRRLAEWAARQAGDDPNPRRRRRQADPRPDARRMRANPFLGMRGIRLSLAKPEPFRTQLRALCRAAAHGAVEVMLPMVTLPGELDSARGYLDEEPYANCGRRASPAAAAELGIMVEVPAAAIAIDAFDAAFFSIGSNDLTQYVMAAARDSDAVAALNDPGHPAVLRLIAQVAAHGAATGRKVSLCGDAGGEPRFIEALLRAGLRALSVARRRSAGPRRRSRASIFRERRDERRAGPRRESRSRRGLQDHSSQCPRSAAVRHAATSGHRAGQEPQFRLAYDEPGLSRCRYRRRISKSSSRSATFRRPRSARSSTCSRAPIPIGSGRRFATIRALRSLKLEVFDFGDAKKNRAFDELVRDTARRLARIVASGD